MADHTTAFEASDVEALVALLADDVRLSMPPFELELDEASSRRQQ